MIGTYRRLKRLGLLGIHDRNINLISTHNPRRLHLLVNDKVITKRLAAEAGIPVPELYGSIRAMYDLRTLPTLLQPLHDFVIKPAQGSQGTGVLVVDQKLGDGWALASGHRISCDDVRFHVTNILSGMFSLGGQPDKAMIEYRVKFDPLFDRVSFKGVPDIRVIVVHGIPVASMVRLPTAESDGRANLHRGGVGVGIDISTGTTGAAIQHDRPVHEHPDTGQTLAGITIPGWRDILLLAARAYDVTQLGYLGVDVVLDRDLGPMLLELNARPGLSIQMAIGRGMARHVRSVMAERANHMTPEARVDYAIEAYRKFAGAA